MKILRMLHKFGRTSIGPVLIGALLTGNCLVNPPAVDDPQFAALMLQTVNAVAGSHNGLALADVPLTGAALTSGYVMTHEHPTEGMAFGGNYSWAGSGNFRTDWGMPDNAVPSCSGCPALSSCDHGEVKGTMTGFLYGEDMSDHPARSVKFDSFSHLRYSSQWIKDASYSAPTTNKMRIMVAYAVENEAMCEMLYYYNDGNGGANGVGYPCTTGDSVNSLERQIAALKKWAADNSSWVEVAYTAAQARDIANRNKLVLILGIESEYAFGAEDRSFDPVDRLIRYHDDGVRTFYLAHKINSRLAGADIYMNSGTFAGKAIRAQQAISGCFYVDDHVAPVGSSFDINNGDGHYYCQTGCEKGGNGTANTFKGSGVFDDCNYKISEISETNMVWYIANGASIMNGFYKYPKPAGFSDASGGSYLDTSTFPGIERNNLSLSDNGERVVAEAMRRGMLINLDHTSSRSRTDIHNISQDYYNYPVNAFHNRPNSMVVSPEPNEYEFNDNELDYIKNSDGIFGHILGPMDAVENQPNVGNSISNCPNTATENAKVLAYLMDRGLNVGYALDFATITEGAHSRTHEALNDGTDCRGLGTDHLHTSGGVTTEGIAHIGQMADWHDELTTVGLNSYYVNELKNNSAEHFLRMWEKSEFISSMPATVMSIVKLERPVSAERRLAMIQEALREIAGREQTVSSR